MSIFYSLYLIIIMVIIPSAIDIFIYLYLYHLSINALFARLLELDKLTIMTFIQRSVAFYGKNN